MQRIVIVNKDGLLSCLPSLPEFRILDYQADSERFDYGLVDVADDVNAAVRERIGKVRVLAPGLPPPTNELGWFYVAILRGKLILV